MQIITVFNMTPKEYHAEGTGAEDTGTVVASSMRHKDSSKPLKNGQFLSHFRDFTLDNYWNGIICPNIE